ncbi:hypothetical protein LZL87_005483 [Fusarium oxysporum]|uniref:Uncharacterized protein n=1 Tax=Fusarium oxysporum f. sp. rapae TaxID=485398 RepID=A0A8J5PJ21_FUSOX|nr:hypothetical protein Forpe1208_v000400 [Fusarium oxysporum f. sp. rapae]KAI7772758.1 hypothetical protein LZL87_005483 [Fusarium oxysporum]
MGLITKLKFKLRKVRAKYLARKRLAQGAAEPIAHEERLAQVHRVEGTEHRIERGIDVMEAARRSVYGAHMLPRTTDFGVSPEEARALHKKQQYEDGAKKAVKDSDVQEEAGIWDGGPTKDDNPGNLI